jgi:ADP-heptose:LPS heptosyltransferase
MESSARLTDVRRIAVLRASAIGDCVVALPALDALRAAYPEARIVLLGHAWHREFWRDRPGPIDEVVALPPIPGITVGPGRVVDLERAGRTSDELRARRFDLALQLHGGGRYSNPFIRRLQAACSAGFRSSDAQALDRWLPYVDDHHPIVLHLLEAVGLVGAQTSMLEPRLHLRAADHAEARAVLPEGTRSLVVLQPGASHPHKCWDARRYAQVGDALAARGALVAVHGSAAEAPLTQRVCGAMRAPALDLAGRLSIGGMAGLLARARLVVGNDTGPIHVARALGTPTVGIYWVANVRSFGPLSTRLHRVATSWRMNCPRCGANAMTRGCDHVVSLVDDVSVDEVLDLAEPLFVAAQESAGQYAPA